MKYYILIFSLILYSFESFPQKKIQGTIKDSLGSPIEFANIGIMGSSIGTVSNADGDFFLSIPNTNLNDTLACSFIGYSTAKFAVQTLNKQITVILTEQNTELQSITITDMSAERMMEMAFEKITI